MRPNARHSLNDKQERFCNLFIACGIAAQAYREAGYKSTSKSLTVCASRMLTNVNIQQRLAELQAVRDARFASKDITKEGLVRKMWEIVHDPAAKRGESIQAGIAVAKLTGWNAATRVEHDLGDRVRQYLEDIRSRPLRTITSSAHVIDIERDVKRISP